MKLYHVMTLSGLILIPLGFEGIFGLIGWGLPIKSVFVGILLLILGLMAFLGGLTAYSFRRPTPEEVAHQVVGDYYTWHFRPVWMLAVVAWMAVIGMGAPLADLFAPDANVLIFYPTTLLVVGAISFRRVRESILYIQPALGSGIDCANKVTGLSAHSEGAADAGQHVRIPRPASFSVTGPDAECIMPPSPHRSDIN